MQKLLIHLVQESDETQKRMDLASEVLLFSLFELIKLEILLEIEQFIDLLFNS